MLVFVLPDKDQSYLQLFSLSAVFWRFFFEHFISPLQVRFIFGFGFYNFQVHLFFFLYCAVATSVLSYSACVPNHFICMALYSKTILTTSLYLLPMMLNTTRSSPTMLAVPYKFFSSLKF